MSGGGEPAPSVRSAFMVLDNPNARSQTIRLHLFRRTSCNLYPSGTTAPVSPRNLHSNDAITSVSSCVCGDGRQLIIAVCSVRVVSGGFFIFRTENGEARGRAMVRRQTVWQVGLTGGGGARRSFTLRIYARGKVFAPQDVKCRRKLCKLSRISKKPSFEGF